MPENSDDTTQVVNTLTLELDDGTTAIWAVPTDKEKQVEAAITAILGRPSTEHY